MKGMIFAAEYLLFLLFSAVINAFSASRAAAFGRGLGLLFYRLDARHRRVTLENLKSAFGMQLTAEARENIARNCFGNLGVSVVEMIRLNKFNEKEFMRDISVEGMENYREAVKKGRGLVFIGAHFGNWELLGIAISLLFQKGYMVARRQDNPYLHRAIEKIRTSTGNRVINKNDAFWEMIKLLKKGELVCVLMDQNVSMREGVFVPFFGRPACTNKGLAMILLKTRTPMVPIFMVRLPDGNHRIVVKPEIPLVHTGNVKNDVRQTTAEINRVIEEMVREYPDQWLWMHRRWKTQNVPG